MVFEKGIPKALHSELAMMQLEAKVQLEKVRN
jgi:hypothetical protein